MAHPIPLKASPRDPRAELQTKLEEAPIEHAEAILAAYEVLQSLHDRGAFDLMRGALGSADKVLEIAVEAAESPQSVRGLRNLLVLINMLGAIDPDALKTFAGTVPGSLEAMHQLPEPSGLWRLIKDFLWNDDFRRGMAALNTLLERFGRGLAQAKKNDGTTSIRLDD